ncbi:Serine/threonine protein kinase [Enhygromyxa salina]|uniref:histidine kinase n=1 Tax=Enhygromyxa salina TaxID=215803 RepID=A0A0C1ZFT6_9BACT|nr:trifunctional serine/threonine-protein kinase/ATP-binding protein/sensor histidine kinase [Enhygromyxa salina]KIG16519.1 Serine/threonine protein kinase [Enhygromyxa salina]
MNPPKLQHYELAEPLTQRARWTLYRGRERATGRAVVIKLLTSELPSLSEYASLTREFELSKKLESPGIAQAIALEHDSDRLVLVFADLPGRSLRESLNLGPLGLDLAIDLAIDLTSVLGRIHAAGITHRQLKPDNIYIELDPPRVVVTDFFGASELSHAPQRLASPTDLDLDLAYISPEQTGRINRAVDHRTDFYSLGVTLYELFTGRRPFASTDPVELVHMHIAQPPTPPEALVAQLAGPLSTVVTRLLAKASDDRYQSAHGIKTDLERCRQLRHHHTSETSFVPGSEDRPERLEFPQRLYAREEESRRLLAAFDRAAEGGCQLVTISGYSGIGKSALVREAHQSIVRRSGYYATGKFDQYQRHSPYRAFVEVFQELIRQVLTESEEAVARWRESLLKRLGANGQVVIEVVPELELLIGPQPPVPSLDPALTQNRFNLAIEATVDAFARPEHPVVLFLDDLQWADAPSLALTERLLSRDQAANLLLIGAYRDNEVDAAHPLTLVLDGLRRDGTMIESITLDPLALDSVEEFVADALRCSVARARPLSDLLYSKVAGNPFFLIQMLEHLVERGLLSFEHEQGRWVWDLDAIATLGVSDNVIALILSRLELLPVASQRILQHASCLGARFSLGLLAVVGEVDEHTVARQLWEPMRDGLVLPLSTEHEVPLALSASFSAAAVTRGSAGILPIQYKFAHDRVHQAAYSMIPDEDKPSFHLEVGQRLLAHAQEVGLNDLLFHVVSNLNLGASLLSERSAELQLAQLNLDAGLKAQASAAYAVARTYLDEGISRVGEIGWTEHYPLTLSLHVSAIEARYLSNDTHGAMSLSETALTHISNRLDAAKIERLRILFEISSNDFHGAIDRALATLAKLGVDVEGLPDDTDELRRGFFADLDERGVTVEDLATLPEMTSADKLVAMELLTTMNAPTFLARPQLWPKVCFMMGRLSVCYGNSFASGFVYVYIANILCGEFGEVERGYAIGQNAANLPERYFDRRLRVQAMTAYNLAIRHWKEPLRDTLEAFQRGIHDALELGDIAFAAFHANQVSSTPMLAGTVVLDEVIALHSECINLAQALDQPWPVLYMSIWSQLALNLHGDAVDPLRLVGERLDEDRQIPEYREQPALLYTIYMAKCMLGYWFGDYAGAVASAEAARLNEGAVQAFANVPVCYFYEGLALLALAAERPGNAASLRERVADIERKLARWAAFGPANYLHKHQLLLAEEQAFFGDSLRANELYEQAIRGAGEQGFVHEQAIACERAARHYLRLGRIATASSYVKSARHGFLRWQAMAKVRQLDDTFGGLLGHRVGADEPVRKSLDVEAVMRASALLTSEVVLDQLLDKLMDTTLANAGSQRAVLLADRLGQWEIEVEGHLGDEQEIVLDKEADNEVPVEDRVPMTIVNYVARTQTTVLLDNASTTGRYTRDPYVEAVRPLSVLCIPLVLRGRLSGVLYLENNLATHVFSPERVELLATLMRQAAIAIENARLYARLEEHTASLEERVRERTAALNERNLELASTLETLKTTQARIVTQEKLASLGVLTSGIAHEIRNPLNIIVNFSEVAQEIEQELDEVLRASFDALDSPTRERVTELLADLDRVTSTVRTHGMRVEKIVSSMRALSPTDGGERQEVVVKLLLHDVQQLALHNERSQDFDSNTTLVCEVRDDAGVLWGSPGALSRALINIVMNALQAARERARTEPRGPAPRVDIHARGVDDVVSITIRDNGSGIRPEIREQIFSPFFTTKPPDRGAGLGLSISNDIVHAHGGTIKLETEPGQFSEFVVSLPRHPPADR